MSLYGEYIKELQGKEIIENEYGFATWYELKYGPVQGVYIEEIYVTPEYRKGRVASLFADQISEIAAGLGYSKIYGTIRASNKTSTEAMKVLLAYGFKISAAAQDAIGLVKDIQ